MNYLKIIENIGLLDIEIRTAFVKMPMNKVCTLTGLKDHDVKAFINGSKKWNYEKILEVAEKLEIAKK